MPTAPRLKFILNPTADRGQAARLVGRLRALTQALPQAEWVSTTHHGHALELARQAGQAGFQRVIAVGGDGTAHEVLNGLMQLPPAERPQMGVVPVGTGNDFAHCCGLPVQPEAALQRCLQGAPRRVDVGRLEDENGRSKFWGNTLGIGFDAAVTIRARRISFLRGFLVYLTAVLQTIALNHHAPRFKVRTEAGDWPEQRLIMLTLCNGERQGGGFLIAPGAKNNDGRLRYGAIGPVSRPEMLSLLPQVMRGAHTNHPKVRLEDFEQMEIETDTPVAIHTDGEIYAGFDSTVRRFKIQLLPAALEVLV